jgi:S1-C subfamily serine protease
MTPKGMKMWTASICSQSIRKEQRRIGNRARNVRRVFLSAILVGAFGLPFHGFAQEDPAEILRAITKIKATIPGNARTALALGTEREGNGVVIDSNGHVLTIGYLILEAEDIEIVDSKGNVVKAVCVGYDQSSGFGLLKVGTPLDVSPMKLGISSEIGVGDPVLIASHGGVESVQGAKVILRDEFAGYWEYLLENAIFTTPPHPNYGGAALIGRSGELVGIGSLLTPINVQSFGMVPSNLFVPIDLIKPILNDLILKGRPGTPPRPWLGVYAQEGHGRIFVVRLAANGPAEKAGLKAGDIVLAVNDQAVEGLSDFYREVWGMGVSGVDVPLRILQGTQIKDIIIRSEDHFSYLRIQKE